MRRPSKFQFGGEVFVGALIIDALIAHAAGCNSLSRHNCIYICICGLFFYICFFVFCIFTHLGTTYLYTMLPRGPIRIINIRRRNINIHVAEKSFGRTYAYHIERHLAPSCGLKRREGYITNQSQLPFFFRKMEKVRNTQDGRASPPKHLKSRRYGCHI